MKTQAELNEIYIDFDYNDNECIVKAFLMCSALNRMKEFDFEAAFEHLMHPIRSKLVEHAQDCTLEEFINEAGELFYHSDSAFEPFTVSTDYIHIDIEDVREAIFKMHYEKSQDAFDGLFDHLIDIKERMTNASNFGVEQANIELFDEVIHAQHVSGDIFEDLDIDDIKSDLDDELIELMGIKVA